MLTVLVIVLLAIAALLGVAASRPDQFRVERSATIQASPERIFPLINDFHRWQAWSPYERKDPAMGRSYEGPKTGEGAVYGWNGKQGYRQRSHADHRVHSIVAHRNQAGILRAVQGHQHRRVRTRTARRRHAANLGHAWSLELHAQVDGPGGQHGQAGRQGFRRRAGPSSPPFRRPRSRLKAIHHRHGFRLTDDRPCYAAAEPACS